MFPNTYIFAQNGDFVEHYMIRENIYITVNYLDVFTVLGSNWPSWPQNQDIPIEILCRLGIYISNDKIFKILFPASRIHRY